MNERDMTKTHETRAFIITAAFFMPLITITLVGTFGFAIWVSQTIFA